MTPKQRQLLEEFGVDTHSLSLSNATAGRWIHELIGQKISANKRRADEAREASLYHLADQHVGSWTVDMADYAHAPCPMVSCNSKRDGFYVNKRQNVGGCTGCGWHQLGEGAGPIGFICAINGVDWIEASQIITGCADYVPVAKAPVVASPLPKEEWRQRMSKCLERAQDALAGSLPMSYLEERGIRLETAKRFGVGAGVMLDGSHYGKPCLILPYHREGSLCAINRRVADKVEADKYRMLKGSRKTGFFGIYGDRDVWVIEGEINAMSVGRVLFDMGLGGCSTVLSLSSESDVKKRAGEVAAQWPDAIVWVDKKELADMITQEYGLQTACSEDGDANELLVAGLLTDRVEELLTTEEEHQYFNEPLIFMDRKTCPTCKGHGLVCWDVSDGAGLRCSECAGAGTVEVEVEMTEAQWDASW